MNIMSQDVIGQYQISVKLLFAAQKCIRPRVCIFRFFYVVSNIIIKLIIYNYVVAVSYKLTGSWILFYFLSLRLTETGKA